MDNSGNHLGVNKMGKNIRKSPLHQPNFGNGTAAGATNAVNNAARQQPHPQVYNISKNDFRNIVQQLTGSSSPSQDPLPRPPPGPPKPQSMRLQRIRPPPLAPMNRPPAAVPPPAPVQAAPPAVPYNNGFVRPAHFGQPSPTPMPPFPPGEMWPNTAESPISAYMRYLQTSMLDSTPRGNQHQPQPQVPAQFQGQPPPTGLLPHPSVHAQPPPPPGLPSPQINSPPPLLPSPTSQFLLPSPTAYNYLLSPRSPYPFLSPGTQFPPLTPNFQFSQPGILGPGPQGPPSPGFFYPLSPGVFPMPSPRWPGQ